VLGLSFGQDSNYMGGHGFVHSNQANVVIGPYIRPQIFLPHPSQFTRHSY